MNEAPMTWYNYLDEYIRLLKPTEKRSFEEALGRDKSSLARWRKGVLPRPKNLQLLYDLLPEQQRHFFFLLLKEDAVAWAKIPKDIKEKLSQNAQNEALSSQNRIPGEVYEEVFLLQRFAPVWTQYSEILSDALARLETYPPTGLEIVVAILMPPRSDGKVRSLREYVGIGTRPWRIDLHRKNYFLGAESLAGACILSRHIEVHDPFLMLPKYLSEHAQSGVASPIICDLGIGGAFIVSSTQRDFFTVERQQLVERYADLIRLVLLCDREVVFQSPLTIELGVMPGWSVQEEHFTFFRQRVESTYKRSLEGDQPLHISAQTEKHVREELEHELLLQPHVEANFFMDVTSSNNESS